MPNDTTEPGDWTPEAIEILRGTIRGVMDAEGLKKVDVARESGIAYGTFAAFLEGKYAGRNDNIAVDASKWLSARETRNRTRAVARPAPGFIHTPSADAFMAVFEHAQHMPDLVVVSGGAGVGKTTAVKRYAASNPNVHVITAQPCYATPRALLQDLSRALTLFDTASSMALSREIVAKVRGTSALIIVDEAQHLTSVTLDQLRSLHDLADIGVALVGNETVYSRLEGAGRTPQFAQLFSRVGMRMQRPRPQQRDITALLDAWEITGKAQRDLLGVIARKPGALRGLTKCLRIAHMLAASGESGVTEQNIRDAWQRLSSTEIGAVAA